MFRRKEDLFENNDPSQAPIESANVVSQPSAQHQSPQQHQALASGSASSSSSAAHTSAPVSHPSAPIQRPAAPAQSFRPAPQQAPIGGDLSRRMPEAKTSVSGALGNSQNSPAAAPASSAPDKGARSGRRILTVGNDILLKGEIATCDRLVIEGKVDASLNDVHTVEIAETGSFKGSANIEDAEISGLFEGDLVVRNRLVIYATGKVRGKITYGEIEIERGGELSGEIKSSTAAQSSTTGAPRARASAKADDKVAA